MFTERHPLIIRRNTKLGRQQTISNLANTVPCHVHRKQTSLCCIAVASRWSFSIRKINVISDKVRIRPIPSQEAVFTTL